MGFFDKSKVIKFSLRKNAKFYWFCPKIIEESRLDDNAEQDHSAKCNCRNTNGIRIIKEDSVNNLILEFERILYEAEELDYNKNRKARERFKKIKEWWFK